MCISFCRDRFKGEWLHFFVMGKKNERFIQGTWQSPHGKPHGRFTWETLFVLHLRSVNLYRSSASRNEKFVFTEFFIFFYRRAPFVFTWSSRQEPDPSLSLFRSNTHTHARMNTHTDRKWEFIDFHLFGLPKWWIWKTVCLLNRPTLCPASALLARDDQTHAKPWQGFSVLGGWRWWKSRDLQAKDTISRELSAEAAESLSGMRGDVLRCEVLAVSRMACTRRMRSRPHGCASHFRAKSGSGHLLSVRKIRVSYKRVLQLSLSLSPFFSHSYPVCVCPSLPRYPSVGRTKCISCFTLSPKMRMGRQAYSSHWSLKARDIEL